MHSFPDLEPTKSIVPCSVQILDLHTDFSGGRSGGLVVPSLEEFPTVVIHTVKGFGIVNKTEVDVFFWISLSFSMIQWMLAI